MSGNSSVQIEIQVTPQELPSTLTIQGRKPKIGGFGNAYWISDKTNPLGCCLSKSGSWNIVKYPTNEDDYTWPDIDAAEKFCYLRADLPEAFKIKQLNGEHFYVWRDGRYMNRSGSFDAYEEIDEGNEWPTARAAYLAIQAAVESEQREQILGEDEPTDKAVPCMKREQPATQAVETPLGETIAARLNQHADELESEPPDLRGPAIIVLGGVLGGFKFYGPFDSIDAALKRYGESLYGKIKAPVTITLLEELK